MTKSTKLLSRNGWKCPKFKIFLGKHQLLSFGFGQNLISYANILAIMEISSKFCKLEESAQNASVNQGPSRFLIFSFDKNSF
jgi:hypothetical protein